MNVERMIPIARLNQVAGSRLGMTMLAQLQQEAVAAIPADQVVELVESILQGVTESRLRLVEGS